MKRWAFLLFVVCATVVITAPAQTGGGRTTYSDLDDSTLRDNGGGTYGWGWCDTSACAGGGINATSQQLYQFQQPSRDQSGSAEFFISGGPYADGLWWYKVGPNDSASNFQFDFWVNVSQGTVSYSQALEFDVFQYIIPPGSTTGRRYMFGTQCNYARGYSNGVWEVWNAGSNIWMTTGRSCPGFVPADWYHITETFNRGSDGSQHYSKFVVSHYNSSGTKLLGSSTYNINVATQSGSLPQGWTENLGVQFQLDLNALGGGSSASYNIWADKVKLTVW